MPSLPYAQRRWSPPDLSIFWSLGAVFAARVEASQTNERTHVVVYLCARDRAARLRTFDRRIHTACSPVLHGAVLVCTSEGAPVVDSSSKNRRINF